MNSEIKKLFLEALDTYSFGTVALKRGDCFCALGILTDLYRRETGKGSWQIISDDNNTFSFYLNSEDEGHQASLSSIIRNWAGITPMNETAILVMNDKSKDFEQVKQFVQEYL